MNIIDSKKKYYHISTFEQYPRRNEKHYKQTKSYKCKCKKQLFQHTIPRASVQMFVIDQD